jgi:hypothetical protein
LADILSMGATVERALLGSDFNYRAKAVIAW